MADKTTDKEAVELFYKCEKLFPVVIQLILDIYHDDDIMWELEGDIMYDRVLSVGDDIEAIRCKFEKKD